MNIKKNINNNKFLSLKISEEVIIKKNKIFFGKKNKLQKLSEEIPMNAAKQLLKLNIGLLNIKEIYIQ